MHKRVIDEHATEAKKKEKEAELARKKRNETAKNTKEKEDEAEPPSKKAKTVQNVAPKVITLSVLITLHAGHYAENPR